MGEGKGDGALAAVNIGKAGKTSAFYVPVPKIRPLEYCYSCTKSSYIFAPPYLK